MAESVKTHTLQHSALATATAYGNSFDAIYVGTSGNIVVTVNSLTVTYANVTAGQIHPIAGEGITAATTAGDMVVMSW